MHESGLCCNPNYKSVVLINTVSENKQGFSKKQINDSEQSKTLYIKLGHPLVKYFMWIFQRQQVVEFPVNVKDIDIAHTIWGKNIAALKRKTVKRK